MARPLHKHRARITGLESAHQCQNDDDDKDKADNTRWPISPTTTMAPSRKDTEQDKNKDDDKNCA